MTLVSFRADALRPFLKARVCEKCIADMKAAGLEFGNPAVTVSDEAARMIQAQADTSFECGEWTGDSDESYDAVIERSTKADAALTAYVAKLEDSLQALIDQQVYHDVSPEGDSEWWAIEGEGHARLFRTAEEALAAFLAARSTTEPEATS